MQRCAQELLSTYATPVRVSALSSHSRKFLRSLQTDSTCRPCNPGTCCTTRRGVTSPCNRRRRSCSTRNRRSSGTLARSLRRPSRHIGSRRSVRSCSRCPGNKSCRQESAGRTSSNSSRRSTGRCRTFRPGTRRHRSSTPQGKLDTCLLRRHRTGRTGGSRRRNRRRNPSSPRTVASRRPTSPRCNRFPWRKRGFRRTGSHRLLEPRLR